jgi:hypothetical protein
MARVALRDHTLGQAIAGAALGGALAESAFAVPRG